MVSGGFRRQTLRGHSAELSARDVWAEIDCRGALRAEAQQIAEAHPAANPWRPGAPGAPCTVRQRRYLDDLCEHERQGFRLPPVSRTGASRLIALLRRWQ